MKTAFFNLMDLVSHVPDHDFTTGHQNAKMYLEDLLRKSRVYYVPDSNGKVQGPSQKELGTYLIESERRGNLITSHDATAIVNQNSVSIIYDIASYSFNHLLFVGDSVRGKIICSDVIITNHLRYCLAESNIDLIHMYDFPPDKYLQVGSVSAIVDYQDSPFMKQAVISSIKGCAMIHAKKRPVKRFLLDYKNNIRHDSQK